MSTNKDNKPTFIYVTKISEESDEEDEDQVTLEANEKLVRVSDIRDVERLVIEEYDVDGSTLFFYDGDEMHVADHIEDIHQKLEGKS